MYNKLTKKYTRLAQVSDLLADTNFLTPSCSTIPILKPTPSDPWFRGVRGSSRVNSPMAEMSPRRDLPF